MSDDFQWVSASGVGKLSYLCGYCGHKVGPSHGYQAGTPVGRKALILICPTCTNPTYFDGDRKQHPCVRLGNEVGGITEKGVASLYNEARDCTSVGAYTAAVLLCRKLLMNIAVQHGADEGKNFVSYIDYLESAGYVPPNGKPWVDVIRKKGNEATHEIALMAEKDGKQILHFVEMLLRFIYEFPSMLEDENT